MRVLNNPKIYFFGKFLWMTGCVRFFVDGDGHSALFRWWHPVTWLVIIGMVPVCAVVGDKISDAVPLKLSPFWQERESEISWL